MKTDDWDLEDVAVYGIVILVLIITFFSSCEVKIHIDTTPVKQESKQPGIQGG